MSICVLCTNVVATGLVVAGNQNSQPVNGNAAALKGSDVLLSVKVESTNPDFALDKLNLLINNPNVVLYKSAGNYVYNSEHYKEKFKLEIIMRVGTNNNYKFRELKVKYFYIRYKFF